MKHTRDKTRMSSSVHFLICMWCCSVKWSAWQYKLILLRAQLQYCSFHSNCIPILLHGLCGKVPNSLIQFWSGIVAVYEGIMLWAVHDVVNVMDHCIDMNICTLMHLPLAIYTNTADHPAWLSASANLYDFTKVWLWIQPWFSKTVA